MFDGCNMVQPGDATSGVSQAYKRMQLPALGSIRSALCSTTIVSAYGTSSRSIAASDDHADRPAPVESTRWS